MNRKKFIAASLLGAAALPEILSAKPQKRQIPQSNTQATKMQICIFSKCLHWLNYADMATFVAKMGFDGIDLTVRKAGHVLPENVITDLPKAIEAAKKAGLAIPMITTDIISADEPHTETVIRTAASLGVKYYRTNWYRYNPALNVEGNLAVFKKQMSGLSVLNKKYGIEAVYQNHAGDWFGASIWDLWIVIKGLDNVGCQYDIRHASAEAANSWVTGLNLIHNKVQTIAIKDFTWVQKNGKWQAESVPLGTGSVNYPEYLKLLQNYRIGGPASMHFEYALGGAEDGANKITISKEDFRKAIVKDREKFKEMLG